jgi:hypothetical protein
MTSMFEGATSFNQPLSGRDTSNVVYMGRIFYNATSFDQDISSWNVSKVYNIGLQNSAISMQNYNALLATWGALSFERSDYKSLSLSSKYGGCETNAQEGMDGRAALLAK